MADVNEIALMVAIEAVDEKMHRLEEEMKGFDPDDEAFMDLQLEYLDCMKAAHSLRSSYEAALVPGDNLPPYEKLVQG